MPCQRIRVHAALHAQLFGWSRTFCGWYHQDFAWFVDGTTAHERNLWFENAALGHILWVVSLSIGSLSTHTPPPCPGSIDVQFFLQPLCDNMYKKEMARRAHGYVPAPLPAGSRHLIPCCAGPHHPPPVYCRRRRPTGRHSRHSLRSSAPAAPARAICASIATP